MWKVLKIIIGIFILSIFVFLLFCLYKNNTYKQLNNNLFIDCNGKTLEITNNKDIEQFKYILENLEYNFEPCKGEVTYKLKYNNEIYYIKEGCQGVQKGNNQAQPDTETLDHLLKIINTYI